MSKNFRYGMTAIALALSLSSAATYAAHGSLCAKDGSNSSLCDITFTTIPTFANLCTATFETGTYTIRNNTPVTMTLNYIRIQNNDGLPAAAATVIASPTNSCGTTLASGASCNITVVLTPVALGTFNRVLQVGVNSRQVELDSPAITPATNCTPVGGGGAPAAPTIGGTPASLFSAAILGTTTVTNTGISAIVGDVDVSPGTTTTGLTAPMVTGNINLDNGTAITAQTNAGNYYNALLALPCTFNIAGTPDLGGTTLTVPGTYCYTSSVSITGVLNLVGPAGSSYTFIIPSTLTTAVGSSVVLSGGIVKGNVNWAIGSSATLNSGTVFQGIIDAHTSITLGTGTSLQGWAWTENSTGTGGAVTLAGTNTVNTG